MSIHLSEQQYSKMMQETKCLANEVEKTVSAKVLRKWKPEAFIKATLKVFFEDGQIHKIQYGDVNLGAGGQVFLKNVVKIVNKTNYVLLLIINIVNLLTM